MSGQGEIDLNDLSAFNERELERYSRQLILPSWGTAAQERLAAASIIVSPKLRIAAMSLAACGAGNIFVLGGDMQLVNELRSFNPHIKVSITGVEAPRNVNAGLIVSGEEDAVDTHFTVVVDPERSLVRTSVGETYSVPDFSLAASLSVGGSLGALLIVEALGRPR